MGTFLGRRSRREEASVDVCGPFTAVRFDDASIVLHPSNRSIVELVAEAAWAFDVLFDLAPHWPTTEVLAQRIRQAMIALRRTLLGEAILGPNESLAFQGETGKPLLRSYPEPSSWRAGSASSGLALRGALVRVRGGALFVEGKATSTAAVAHAFAEEGADAIGRDVVSVARSGTPALRSNAWREWLPASQIWSVRLGMTSTLTLSRLPPERALLKLLGATASRPDVAALGVLASVAGAVQNFAVDVPREQRTMAAAFARYRGLEWP